MHIAFISSDRAKDGGFDRDTALIEALEALGVEVTIIVPCHPFAYGFERSRAWVFRRLGYNVSTACDASRLRLLANSIEEALRVSSADVIFSRSTHFTAWLDTHLPKVNYVDAVFDCIVDFYPSHTHLDFLSRWAGHRAEKRALAHSSLTLLKSFWAAAKAINCYRIAGPQLGVVQAPAILPFEPSRSEVLSARSGGREDLKCLIIGNDWLRKGADIALEAVRQTRIMGLDVSLTTLGMEAPSHLTLVPWLKILPPLQKGNPAEFFKFCQIFLDADVLLLPARADFSPNVISEAYAFGLPTIGSPVGAIPEMIEHGQTGFVTRRVDDAEEYAKFICRIATEPGLRSHMAIESRNKYEAEFALPVVARKIVSHLESVIYQTAAFHKNDSQPSHRKTMRCQIP